MLLFGRRITKIHYPLDWGRIGNVLQYPTELKGITFAKREFFVRQTQNSYGHIPTPKSNLYSYGNVRTEDLRKVISLFHSNVRAEYLVSSLHVRFASTVTSVQMKDKELEKIFSNLDISHSGFLTTRQLSDALANASLHNTLIHQIIHFLTKGKSNQIELKQFLALKEMPNPVAINALKRQLIIPDFDSFSSSLHDLYFHTEQNHTGNNANYIPQLAQVPSHYFGLSLCTIDGQFFSIGDTTIPFTIQSTSKLVTYCMVNELIGTEKLTKHVGQEPSGMAFNAYALDSCQRAHNPMVNVGTQLISLFFILKLITSEFKGAIVTSSLLHPLEDQAKRFNSVRDVWEEIVCASVSFDNATYLSEFEHADRNYALAYMAKNAGGMC
jgi:glutaminase